MNLFIKTSDRKDVAPKLAAALLAPSIRRDKLSIEVENVYSREDADTYVRNHIKDLDELFNDAFAAYNGAMRELSELKEKFGDFDLHLTGGVPCHLSTYMKMLDDMQMNLLCIKGVIANFYYTHTEVLAFKDSTFGKTRRSLEPSHSWEHDTTGLRYKSSFAYPNGLEKHLSDIYVDRFLPSETIMGKCSVKSQVAPELILKGICLGDYIGQPYEGLISRDYYDPEKPFDVHANVFTDDSIMSLAIYDACKSIKNTEFNGLNLYEIIPRAYEMFVRSMRYYVNMLPNAGYGPRFYAWAVNGAADYDSHANGGAMRSGVIGAFFDNIRDVIKYAIISAYATHKHPSGEKGAVLTAVCVWLAAHGASKDDIKAYASAQCKDIYTVSNREAMMPEEAFDVNLTPADLKLCRSRVLFGIATVSEAVINFLNSDSYAECISNAMIYECDADTVAAISGGIAAAYYRDVPYMDDIVKARSDEKIPYETKFVMNRLAML